MEHFEYYLYVQEFIVRSDHKALEVLNTKGEIGSDRTYKWIERTQRFF